MNRWEYKSVRLNISLKQRGDLLDFHMANFNNLGFDGWELIFVADLHPETMKGEIQIFSHVALFKRQVTKYDEKRK